MPGQGYTIIGLKPVIIAKLQKIMEDYCPAMFIPSVLIILMSGVKQRYYTQLTRAR
ncbi:MAG: hypothetical protein M3218_05620 [Thermoproteota archaeon]|nr:hypothetical protein [Thermoproteota archaeon]